MAKKETIKESVETTPKKTDLFSKMRKNILKKNEDAMLDLAEPKIWATSGNFVLNHILSGKFSRGYPASRITQIFGDSGSGKSFLMAKAIAEAQKEGYMVAVLDSEQAVSQDYLRKIGVDLDPSMLMTVQVNTVEQTQDLLIEVLNGVKEEQDKLGNVSDLKLMLIVDSIGMLSSGKAAQNAEDGHHAADMGTKAKALTNMFNQVVQKVGVTESVCLITNHGAFTVGDFFPTMKPKGGQCLVGGTLVETVDGLKSVETVQVGDLVRTHMDRLRPVTKLFNFDDLEVLEVELETGQTIKMSKDHKMLVLRNGEKLWLEAEHFTTEDCLLELAG